MTERADFLVNNRSPRYLHGFQKDTNETTELPHTVPVDNQATYIDSFTNYGVDTVYGKEYVIAAGSPPAVHNSLPGRSDADAHPASSITNTPAGNIAATTVQAAINELDSEKAQLAAPLTNQRVPFANASGFLTDNANFYYVSGTGLLITDATASISTTTGALVVTGGIGTGDGIYAGGLVRFQNTTQSSSPTSGCAAFSGGVGINVSSIGATSNSYGLYVLNTHNTPGPSTDAIYGGRFSALSSGNNPPSQLIGFLATTVAATPGTTASIFGTRFGVGNAGSGTVTNAYGLFSQPFTNTGGGAIGTAYGIYISNINVASTNYAIYTSAGAVRFGGATTIVDTTVSTSTTTGALVVSGGVGIAGALNVGTTIDSNVYTVATLPTGNAGMRAFVSDANATTFASIVAGGGTNGVPVYHDGTNWRIG